MHAVLEHLRIISHFPKASLRYQSACLPSQYKQKRGVFIDRVNRYTSLQKKPVWLVSLGVDKRWKEIIKRDCIGGMIISHVVGTKQ